MAARLHYLPGSPFARILRVLIREHGLPVEEVEVSGFPPPDDFFATNPLGQVPVYESGGSAWFPTLPALMALFDDIMRQGKPRPGLAPTLCRDGHHLHDLQTLQVILSLGDLSVTARYIAWTGLTQTAPSQVGHTIADRTAVRAAHTLDWLECRIEGPGFRPDGLSAQDVALAAILLDQMTPDIRRRAKAINFGVIYGISGFGLARNLRIPRQEAQAFIDRYFERFPGIRAYMDATVKFAQANGHVQTLFGRKIHTPDINAKGPGAGFARRAAINAPIQGTAADVIRRAMIRMPKAIAGLDAKMLLQVHDELLFEVAEDQADTLTEIARDVMQQAAHPAVDITVPLVVEAGRGMNWAEAH